jgi:hypothetical protein
MKRCLLLVVSAFAFACSSQPVRPEGAAVIIKQGHFHTRYCGHYRFHDQWYFMLQHRHGVDCGHELVDGDWTLVDD